MPVKPTKPSRHSTAEILAAERSPLTRPNLSRNAPGAEATVLAVEAAAGATTIAAIHGSRANRAGSFSRTKYVRSGWEMPGGDKQRDARGYVCQEADQHLQSAKKNRRGSRDNGTKQSEGINGNKRKLLRAAW